MSLANVSGPQLQVVQWEHAGIVAPLEVPCAEAQPWLAGCRCGSMFLCPFFGQGTSGALWWLHGLAALADAILQMLRLEPSFVDPLAGEVNIAVRVMADVDQVAVQQQMHHPSKTDNLALQLSGPASK